MQLIGYSCHLLFWQRHFAQDGGSLLCVEPLKIFFAWSDDEAGHIQRTGADEKALVVFGKIAVGAVFPSGEEHDDDAVVFAGSPLLPPGQQIKVGFALLLLAGQV